MKIDKSQVLDMLRSKGDHDQADQAESELPDQVDTDNPEHQSVLAKFGVDLDGLKGKLGGLGNLL